MDTNIINAAIQVVPINVQDGYAVVDRAIELIADSGLPYLVGPFSTSVEGTFEEVQKLIHQIKTQLLAKELNELLINIQLHCKADGDMRASDKVKS
ncbi:MAG: thiamine-binding protein [Bacteroidota bacterium]